VEYSAIGLNKFINWLDEEGKKDELGDDLLIAMEGEGEPTPQHNEEAEKAKEKAKLKAEKKAKYKSTLHLKPPTSSMFLPFLPPTPLSFIIIIYSDIILILSLALGKTHYSWI
jgi:hypothetical protein